MPYSSDKRWLVLILALGLVRGLLYALMIPPWQAPDEIAHFEYARLLLEYKRPVTVEEASPKLEQQIIQSLYQFHAYDFVGYDRPEPMPTRLAQLPFFGKSRTLGRFSLAYGLFALAVWPWKNQDVVVQLYSMRLLAVALGLGSIGLTWLTARRLAPRLPALATGAALLLLFWPGHTAHMSTVGEGVLAELLTSSALYLFVTMTLAGASWPRVAGYLACVGLAISTKATAYFLVPFTLILGLNFVLYWLRFSSRLWRNVIGLSLLALVATGIWVFTQGGLIALGTNIAWGQDLLKQTLSNSSWALSVLQDLFFSGGMATGLWALFRSTWASLGWMVLFAPEVCNWVLLGLCLLALAGLVFHRGRPLLPAAQQAISGLGLAAALAVIMPILTAFLIWRYNPLDALQGRYILVAALPLAILLMLGWCSLWPTRTVWVVRLIVAGGLTFDTIVLIGTALPFFYPYR